jgi:dTDP-3-amino-3,4,6-trideoxy-alpha-D-glucose transaminase
MTIHAVETVVPFLDLRRQSLALLEEIEQATRDVLYSGRFVNGPLLDEFEQAFAAWCGARDAVGVASGTDAIELALRAFDIGPGDEVVTVANTCVPTIAGIEATGARAVLVDIDERTFTLDPAALASAIGRRTRAIVPVHMYGQCADMASILAIARSKGLVVVEDAAQGHGAEYRGVRAGALGDAAAFSFYPTKNLGALGDAGAVVVNDRQVAARVRRLRNYGERGRFESFERGMNSRLDTLQAAILSAKLPYLDGWNARRRELAARYDVGLRGTGLDLPESAPGRRHAFHLYVVRSRERDVLRAELAARGVETLVHYPKPVHRVPAYTELAHARLTRSERVADEILSLPLFPELTDDEVDHVVAAIRDALGA